MRPDPRTQIRLGVAACLVAVFGAIIVATVPDLLFRSTVIETSVDDANGIVSGVPVTFMGGAVGKVRWVRLDPQRSLYNLGLQIRKDWAPPPCAVVRIAAANPLTAPKIEIVVPEHASQPVGAPRTTLACAGFFTAIACTPIAPPARAKASLVGCVRQGDLTQLVAKAVSQASSAIAQGQVLIARLENLTGAQSKGAAGGADLSVLATNVTETTQSVNAIARKINATLTPQSQEDVGAVISNVRKVSDKAAKFDAGSVQMTVSRTNALLEQTTALLKDNRENIQTLTAQGADATQDGRDVLSTLQTSTSNLERISANLDAITERLKGDPGYLIKGGRMADPPDPGAKH